MTVRFVCYAAVLCIALVLSGGCITFAKTMMTPPPAVVLEVRPESVRTPIPVKEEPQPVFVEYRETEDMLMYRTGGRYLGETYRWERDNCSGQKDMAVNVMVYNYKILHGYDWWSISWGRYFYQMPMPGQKYLVVQVRMEMEGQSNDKDPRMYGMGQDHFYIQYGEKVSNQPDTDHWLGERIKELEETFTYNDDGRVYDYGYQRAYTPNGTEYAQDLGYLRMGKSNAWDGFILYSIPEEIGIEDILIHGRFDGFGYAYWKLTKRPV